MRDGARTMSARAGGKKSIVLGFWMSAGPPSAGASVGRPAPSGPPALAPRAPYGLVRPPVNAVGLIGWAWAWYHELPGSTTLVMGLIRPTAWEAPDMPREPLKPPW